MADLVISDADLQLLSGALGTALTDLGALQRSMRGMDSHPVGAPPLVDAETTFTTTRNNDLDTLGRGIADLSHQVELVGAEMGQADQRLGSQAK